MARPRLSLLALGAGVTVLVAAASPRSAQTQAVASPHGKSQGGGGTLRLMGAIWPGSVDTGFAVGTPGSYSLLNATCAKLYRTVYDPDTGIPQVVPEVAVGDPKITDDGRTY